MYTEVLSQVVILFILIAVGFVLAKTKVLGETAAKGMTDVCLLLVTPCVIIKSFIRKFEPALLKNLLISFAAAFGVHILMIVLSRLLLHSKEIESERVLRFGAVFSNCGFMSIPLQQALLGDMGVFYGASFVAVFNLFAWSYGILEMSGDKKYLTAKKLIINPGILGLVIGIAVFVISPPLPKFVTEPISYIASLNTPLPMLIIGYYLATSNLLRGFKYVKCYFAVGLRLIIFPVISVALLKLCGMTGDMLVSVAISVSAPTAAITTMFSSKFSQNTGLSCNMVSLSTLLSIVTMPLVITFAQMLS